MHVQTLDYEAGSSDKGWAMPSDTMESPPTISLVKTLARRSMLHQDAEKTGFGKKLCMIGLVYLH